MKVEQNIKEILMESSDLKVAAALEHIIRIAVPIIKDRLAANRTSDEAAADVLSGLYWLKTSGEREQLKFLADELIKYQEDCEYARSWGGPTIYPPNPVGEKRALQIGSILKKWLKLSN